MFLALAMLVLPWVYLFGAPVVTEHFQEAWPRHLLLLQVTVAEIAVGVTLYTEDYYLCP